MGSVRRHRSWAGWLAVFAILGNILASAFCCTPRDTSPELSLGDTFAVITICTAEGMKTLIPGGDGPNAPAKPACAVCVLMAAFALTFAVALIAILAWPRSQPPTLRPLGQLRPVAFQLFGFSSRAPPIPA